MLPIMQFDEAFKLKLDEASRRALNAYQRDTSHIGRGRDHWSERNAVSWAAWVERVLMHQMNNPFVVVPKDAMQRVFSGDYSQRPVVAEVSHNRWIAVCECGGCEVVDPEAPLFYCFSCYNIADGGLARSVAFPPDWDQVERVLMVRMDPLTRNFLPGETLDKLRAENMEHGLAGGGD